MDLDDALARLDEGSLARFLSASALDLLKLCDRESVRISSLADLVRASVPPAQMLRDPDKRRIILMAMREEDAADLARSMGLAGTGDPFVDLRNAAVRKNSHAEKALFGFFGIEHREEAKSALPYKETVSPERPLFRHQIEAVEKIKERLDAPPHRVLLHMPTGSGKTRSAMRAITTVMLEDPSALVIWLAYSEELCEQAMEEFQKTWALVGDRDVETFRFFGGSGLDPVGDTKAGGFMVAGLLKMYQAAKRDNVLLRSLADRASLVAMDEAHQIIADKFRFVVDQLVAGGAGLLGLSATPGRTTDEGTARLSDFFAGQKITLAAGSNPVDFLMENGYIARPDFNLIRVDADSLTDDDLRRIQGSYDIPDSVLAKLSEDTLRNLRIIGEVERLAAAHRKIIVFAASIGHARDLSIVLRARGHNSAYITSATPADYRQETLRRYREEDSGMILCNYNILSVGFDAPKTSAVVIARPTKSHVLYTQMVGRAIRGRRAGGNERCSISTIADVKIEEFVGIVDMYSRWDEVWA